MILSALPLEFGQERGVGRAQTDDAHAFGYKGSTRGIQFVEVALRIREFAEMALPRFGGQVLGECVSWEARP